MAAEGLGQPLGRPLGRPHGEGGQEGPYEIGPHFLGGSEDLVGVTGMVFTPAGDLVLVSERSPFLRWFSPQGVLRAYVDEGSVSTLTSTRPPRFRRVRRPPRDAVALWVPALGRIGSITPGGQVRWSAPIEAESLSGEVVGALDWETLLIREVRWDGESEAAPAPGPAASASVRVPSPAHRVAWQEQVVLSLHRIGAPGRLELGIWPGRTWVQTPYGRQPIPFGLAPVVTVGGGEVIVAEPHGELLIFNRRGTLTRRHQTEVLDRPIEAEDRARFLRIGEREVGVDATPALEALLASVPADARIPAFDGLLRAPTGHLWARLARLDPDEPARWLILDPAGQPVGDPVTPPELSVRAVHEDAIAGAAYHTLMFEIVRIYPVDLLGADPALRRGTTGPSHAPDPRAPGPGAPGAILGHEG
jgi:hypothetical protein